jgi:hypothetical protein
MPKPDASGFGGTEAGTRPTKKAAQQHERQVQYFKRH